MFDSKALQLYAITDRHWLGGRQLIEVVDEALAGGVTMLQLRDKGGLAPEKDDRLREGKEIAALAKSYRVPFLVDDDVEFALAIGADGVHVGQSDMAAKKVRPLIGSRILGVSAKTVEEAEEAERNGADYLGVGAVFPTSSKDDAKPIERKTFETIAAAVSLPIVAIGGITLGNMEELRGIGAKGVAVISAIFAAGDIKDASHALRQKADDVFDR